jgi:orotidine-5'-phosphate decarboxylase
MRFSDKLEAAWKGLRSMVCVGLDPSMESLPGAIRSSDKPFLEFNKRIIDATLPYACAYKPQFAYYAAENRLDELYATMEYLRQAAPDRITILDAKRGDIGSTADQYAREAFEVYGADAVTVNPYMGGDTLLPFTKFADKGVVVLCKTSNPGSSELQDLVLESGRPLFMEVARKAAAEWNTNGNLCLVTGATWPDQLEKIRAEIGDMPLLVPGVGAQGGDLEATLRAGLRPDGWGLMINSSRGIIFASRGADFADAAAQAARTLNESCITIRSRILDSNR